MSLLKVVTVGRQIMVIQLPNHNSIWLIGDKWGAKSIHIPWIQKHILPLNTTGHKFIRRPQQEI